LIVFHGAVPPTELHLFTQAAFLGFNLLENKGKSYFYSAANKFFDYVQAGVPVISMLFPEYEHLMQEYEVGLLLEDLETQSIVEAVKLAEGNPELYKKWQDKCLIAIQQWCWETQAPKLLAIYDAF
jgi:glycosyltransferase involved in cell wall biosynthesis